MAAAAASTNSSGGHDMGNMSMGGDMTCKISMLWNWTTIDACFLSTSWHITSKGMFAVSCIGVVFLVVILEGLRRLGKEYDARMLRQFRRNISGQSTGIKVAAGSNACGSAATFVNFRPTPTQQLVRSVIHMATFGVAYILMLLAMYFNGYIIISIVVGALLGKFLCDWPSVKVQVGGSEIGGSLQDAEEPTVCCG